MNYLVVTIRPDIIFAVHQCAKYSIDPKQSYEESAKIIGRYLKKTKDKGLFFKSDGSNIEGFDSIEKNYVRFI